MINKAKQLQGFWGGIFVCLLLVITGQPVSAETTDRAFCRIYARDMISLPQQKQHTLPMCQLHQSHWKGNKNDHIKACLAVSKIEANKKRYSHNKLVNLCNDTYKVISLDRHRLANLLLNTNEKKRLEAASPSLKQVLLQGKMRSPYRQRYAVMAEAIKQQQLQQCDWYSLAVDMDNNTTSKEWVLTLDAGCLAEQKTAHVWLIQQLEGIYYVLFEGDSNTLTLRYDTHNGYKKIAMSTRLRANEENDQRCGSIKAEWHYVAGRYLPFKGKADEHGDCLPKYNLPDYLQGENTLSLSAKTWNEGIQAEEKRRMALFFPYKKALEAYVPQWILQIKQQVPARPSLASPIMIGKNTVLLEEKNRKDKKEKQQQSERENKSEENPVEKSIIQSIREFLGL